MSRRILVEKFKNLHEQEPFKIIKKINSNGYILYLFEGLNTGMAVNKLSQLMSLSQLGSGSSPA